MGKKIKLIITSFILLFLIICIQACSNNSSLNELTFSSTYIYACVDNIDEDVYSITLGSISSLSQGGQMGGEIGGQGQINPGETPPENPDGEGETNPGETPPEIPDGEGETNPGETPPEIPDGEGENVDPMGTTSMMFTKTDTQAKLVINNKTKIYNSDGTSADISNISVNTIIEIETNDSGNITKITIMDAQIGDMQNGGGMIDPNQNNPTEPN